MSEVDTIRLGELVRQQEKSNKLQEQTNGLLSNLIAAVRAIDERISDYVDNET